MDGFYYKDPGGKVNGIDQVVGEMFLPPGNYIVIAKAHMAIASNSSFSPDASSTAYRLKLILGSDEDETIGGLLWDFDDPGSRYESVTLNVAAEVRDEGHVRLLASATTDNKLLCFSPRISAFQLDGLHFFGREDGNATRYKPNISDRLWAGVLLGYSLGDD